MEKTRTEKDSLGPVEIPAESLWGPQTERSRHNFMTGPKMPLAVIRAILAIKKTAAQTNLELAQLDQVKAQAIITAVCHLEKMSDSELRTHFPLVVYQTGSGTQSNMNVNEVIAHLANVKVQPNDDVNCGQSSNDVFPTAMHLASLQAVNELICVLREMIVVLKQKKADYWQVVKIGRTHLQDATPLTFGQELSGYQSTLEHDLTFIDQLKISLYELAIGGTAVGTGLNAHPLFAKKITEKLSGIYQEPFTSKSNKFYGLAAHSPLNALHGALKTLASDLLKIANDIRLLASGPRSGLGEICLPANEPGSSIMPGKVNPTQTEALTMAAVRVMGNDTTMTIAASQGNFELNVYKPLLIATFLESVDLLTKSIRSFTEKCLVGMTVDAEHMQDLVDRSLMTATALTPYLGYEETAKIAQLAQKNNWSLKKAALASGKVSSADFDRWIEPLKMTNLPESEN